MNEYLMAEEYFMVEILDFAQTKQLRVTLKKQRRSLNQFALRQAEQHILHQVMQLPELKSCQHIGIYLDDFGEIPTKKIMFELFKRHKRVYLPLICSMNQTLHWQPISLQQWRSQRFAIHRLGVRQAMQSRGQATYKLDILLMPLVIFDNKGHRVGMGGGFYDRTLAQSPHQPYRVGLAHDFQQSLKEIQTHSWDQALDCICTPTRRDRFKRV